MPDTLMTPHPALSVLQPLVGAWTMKITWSEKTRELVGGPPSVEGLVTFEWSPSGSTLVQTVNDGGTAVATWGFVPNKEISGAFRALYADSRGVSRIYEMSFTDGLWKIWRAAPGFHQRFASRISPDGRTIEGRWEKSEDGEHWENDFDLTYTKAE
jgi:hypothetical protein